MNRKLRKLIRRPHLFLLDAGKNLARKSGWSAPRASGKRTKRTYSYVVVINEASVDLNALIERLMRQTVDTAQSLQLVVVDTRNANEISKVHRTERHSAANVEVLCMPGAGLAEARNAALSCVTGDWLLFADPSDGIPASFLASVDAFLRSPKAANVAMLCCNLVYRDKESGAVMATHPLRQRFQAKLRIFHVSKGGQFFQPSTEGVLFRTSVLRSAHFSHVGLSGIEEAVFVNTYLLAMGKAEVGLCAAARYEIDSGHDVAKQDDVLNSPEDVVNRTNQALVDLLAVRASPAAVAAPGFIQRAVLYIVTGITERSVSKSSPACHWATAATAPDAINGLFVAVVGALPTQSLDQFDLTSFRNRVGLLGRYGSAAPKTQLVYVDGYDEKNDWIRLRYFVWSGDSLESFQLQGQDVLPVVAKTRVYNFLAERFVSERIVWLPCHRNNGILRVEVDGVAAKLSMLGKQRTDLTPWKVAEALNADKVKIADPSRSVRAIRWLARQQRTVSRYRNAWLFMDRDVEADDNAEHLYRYVRGARPDINAFFILSEKSPSWKRLQEEGFRLLPFGSLAHKLALLNARHLLSSHAAPFVVSVLPKKWYGDLLNYRFTFLQHGVTKDDISRWINSRSIDCFVTTSPREFQSIAGDGNGYKLTSREVVLTGFPRHDALISSPVETEKLLMIMPTWRLALSGGLRGKSSARAINDEFFASEFALRWKEILHADRLKAMCEVHGYKLVFFPHPNIEPYLDWFAIPDHIEVLTPKTRGSIQTLFRRSAAMLTDYSSVAFEMAYLKKPVLYYQFDREAVFNGGHSYLKGYYEYELDGFGPVAYEKEHLLDELQELLSRDARPNEEQMRRMTSSFAAMDGNNCERTLQAVLQMDERLNGRGVLPARELAIACAESAARHGKWKLAAARWERVIALDGPNRPVQPLLQLAKAYRQLGDTAKAETLLLSDELRLDRSLDKLQLSADLAIAGQRWEEARQLLDELRAFEGLEDTQGCQLAEWLVLADAEVARGDQVSGAPQEAGDDSSDSGISLEATRESAAIDTWRRLLDDSAIDENVVMVNLKSIVKRRIRNGQFDLAEQDIDEFSARRYSPAAESLLRLELALARGYTGEAKAHLNTMLNVPLASLSRSEQSLFAHYLHHLDAAGTEMEKCREAVILN